jgi:hypothetical protein
MKGLLALLLLVVLALALAGCRGDPEANRRHGEQVGELKVYEPTK